MIIYTSSTFFGEADYSHVRESLIDACNGDEVKGAELYDSAIRRMVGMWNHLARSEDSTAEWNFESGEIVICRNELENTYPHVFERWRKESEAALDATAFSAKHILERIAEGKSVPEYRHYLGCGFWLWEGTEKYVITTHYEDPYPLFCVRRDESGGLEVACSPDSCSEWASVSLEEAVRRAEFGMALAVDRILGV